MIFTVQHNELRKAVFIYFRPLSELRFGNALLDEVEDADCDDDEKSEVRGRRKISLKLRLCFPVTVMIGSFSPMVGCCSMSTDENILLASLVELAVVLGDTPLSVDLPFSALSFRNSIEEQALPDRSSPLGSAEMEDLWWEE